MLRKRRCAPLTSTVMHKNMNDIATSSIEEGLDFAFNLIMPIIADAGEEDALQAKELLSHVSTYVTLRYAGELQLAYEWLQNFEDLNSNEKIDRINQFKKQLKWLETEINKNA